MSSTDCDGAQDAPRESVNLQESPGASNSLTLRVKIASKPGMLAKVLTLIGTFKFDVGNTPIVGHEHGHTIREIVVNIEKHLVGRKNEMIDAVGKVEGVTVLDVADRTFEMHRGGKLDTTPRVNVDEPDDLSMVYTPGVARVCTAIYERPELAYEYTIKGNTILIVTDGSRLLALGNYGARVPVAAEPVMSGKALLFKRFGNVNAVPICLNTQDPEEIIRIVKAISPAYGGVNLEDIASPGCWYIERRLKEEMDIPVFHDDQHGTAVVVLAGTINAARLVKKQLRNLRVRVAGVGAAGMACCKLLIAAGVRNLIGYNIGGAIYEGRPDMNDEERWLAANSNPRKFKGTLKQSLKDADMFLGLAAPGLIDADDVRTMRKDAIIFALANPTPEIDPTEAAKVAAVVATGSSEYDNQINNALVFPGIFRGALDARVGEITEEMKMEAARALAAVIPVSELKRDYIIPSIFEPQVHQAVAAAVVAVAKRNAK